MTPNTPTVFLQNSEFEKSVTSPSSSSATIQYSPPPPPPTTTSKGDHLLSQGQYTNCTTTTISTPSATTTISPSTSNYNFSDFMENTFAGSELFPATVNYDTYSSLTRNPKPYISSKPTPTLWMPYLLQDECKTAMGIPKPQMFSCANPIVKVKPLKIQEVQVSNTTTPENIDEAATASSEIPPEASTSKDFESDTTEDSIWSPSVEHEKSEEEYIKVTRGKHRTKTRGQILGNKRKFTKRK